MRAFCLGCFFILFFGIFSPTVSATDAAYTGNSPLEALGSFSPVYFDVATISRKDEILAGLEQNINYFSTAEAVRAYDRFGDPDITLERVRASLLRLRTLIRESKDSHELQERVNREFTLFRSKGRDGKGTVHFTGYFQPVYKASLDRTADYQYPIYRMPGNFSSWKQPHPTRVALEGYNGKGALDSPVRGYELAWLRSRYEVFMIQIQGSAILELPNGDQKAVGFAAGTNYPFNGVPKEYLKEKGIAWSGIKNYFSAHPAELDAIVSRNNRFIFFQEKAVRHPIGSLGVPVVAEQSIATDKTRLPPGAVGIIKTAVPQITERGKLKLIRSHRLVLDQDTGSAIKGPGRVDIFMGTGPEAQRRADAVYSEGELYYLLLRKI